MKRSTKKIIRNSLITVLILISVIVLVLLFVDFPTDTEKCISIETPYCELQYPDKWEDELRVEHNDGSVYSVGFFGTIDKQPEQHLFDIWFGAEGDNAYDYIATAEGEIIGVGVELYEFDLDDSWNEKQIEILVQMQDDMHVLLKKLPSADFQEETVDTESSEDEQIYEDIVIDTPYGQLNYPGNWKEQLEIKHIDEDIYTVEFYGKLSNRDEQYLFAVCFGGDQGETVGTITDANGEEVSVNILMEEFVPGEDWTEEETNTIYAMQEGVNEIVDNLI